MREQRARSSADGAAAGDYEATPGAVAPTCVRAVPALPAVPHATSARLLQVAATGKPEGARGPRSRSPAWHRDEIILALDLFLRAGCLGGGSLPLKTDPEVVELSARINALPIWREADRAATFRNPAGVALKLGNLRAVERDVALQRGVPGAQALPKGMGSYSALDRVVFEEFVGRFEDLPLEAEAVWAAAGFARASMARDARGAYLVARDAPIDGGGILTYESGAGPAGSQRRGEAALVLAYSGFLQQHGHEVSGRHYLAEGESRPLRADLLVKDLNVLVEAKSTDARYAIRSAIGQLYDYRRFEPSAPELAVLVPTEPVRDLRRLLEGLSIGCVWPRGDGFRDSVDGRLCA